MSIFLHFFSGNFAFPFFPLLGNKNSLICLIKAQNVTPDKKSLWASEKDFKSIINIPEVSLSSRTLAGSSIEVALIFYHFETMKINVTTSDKVILSLG
jgi:hypothetical protein